MSEATPEPRIAVMIVADASWEDHAGTPVKARVRMENKSKSGACIQSKRRIAVGTKIRVQARWDEFSGVVKYCKAEEDGYRVGIRRDPKPSVIEPWLEAKPEPKNPPKNAVAPRRVDVGVREVMRSQEVAVPDFPVPPANFAKVKQAPKASLSALANEVSATELERPGSGASGIAESKTPRETQLPATQLSAGEEARKERKTMGSKLMQLAHWKKKEESLHGNENAAGIAVNSASHNGAAKSSAHAAVASALAEKGAAAVVEKRGEEFQVELLPMEDIYRAAGIVNPRRGYSVTKVIEMLHSEHLCGLSKEMKRASVLMALDAAGVSIEDVLRDAKVRQEAIDSYEAEQRKQFEALWSQKAEENAQINAEMERVKASYAEKIKRNQDGVAREKSTFVTWLTSKQQEAQDMDEAVELCTKPVLVQEPASNTSPAAKVVGVNAKAV